MNNPITPPGNGRSDASCTPTPTQFQILRQDSQSEDRGSTPLGGADWYEVVQSGAPPQNPSYGVKTLTSDKDSDANRPHAGPGVSPRGDARGGPKRVAVPLRPRLCKTELGLPVGSCWLFEAPFLASVAASVSPTSPRQSAPSPKNQFTPSRVPALRFWLVDPERMRVHVVVAFDDLNRDIARRFVPDRVMLRRSPARRQ